MTATYQEVQTKVVVGIIRGIIIPTNICVVATVSVSFRLCA